MLHTTQQSSAIRVDGQELPVNHDCLNDDFSESISSLPHLDVSDTTFETDVIAVAGIQPSVPKVPPWE